MNSRTRCALVLLSMIGLVVATGAFAQDDPVYNPELAAINDQLALMGVSFQLETAEYFTTAEGPDFGNTVLAKDVGNKQLSHHFVPFDSRRPWSGPGSAITWINDTVDGSTRSGLSAADTAGAIRSAMQTWEDVQCSELPLNDLGDIALDLGFVQYLLGYSGSPFIFADVTHAGWLPGAFFNTVAPNGSTTILGVTFTFARPCLSARQGPVGESDPRVQRNGQARAAPRLSGGRGSLRQHGVVPPAPGKQFQNHRFRAGEEVVRRGDSTLRRVSAERSRPLSGGTARRARAASSRFRVPPL